MKEFEDYIVVSGEKSGLRVDSFLSFLYPELSRTYIQKLIENECICVNGKQVKKRYKTADGDAIAIRFMPDKEITLEGENIPLDILYEDEELIVVNKPPGMVVHPAAGNWKHTLVHALLYHCQDMTHQDPIRPGIIHRLDKDTSGVLIAAKTRRMHELMSTMFQKREIQKSYLAIVARIPEEVTLDLPIGRDQKNRKKMRVDPDKGKEAVTHVTVLESTPDTSLVRLYPKTGRTHQLRVHMRHIQCPIIGDALYGYHALNERFSVKRQLLHAEKISFIHPLTHRQIEWSAPIPRDMVQFIERYM